jgi:mannose-6-phosphate isomerase-like protein (cupin superfamily)
MHGSIDTEIRRRLALLQDACLVHHRGKGGISMPKEYVMEIKKEAKQNECFRKVLATAQKSQVVLMSLQPGEEIGMEVHDGDQIIYVVEGDGLVVLDSEEREVEKGTLILVPAGVQHNLMNTDDKRLKLFTIYAPPQHAPGTVQATRKDAEMTERHPQPVG